MKQSIAALDSKISSMITSINENFVCTQKRNISPNNLTITDNDVLSKQSVKASSYASVASSNLSNVVKLAVAETIRQHKAVERSNASVTIYNLREHGNDARDARELLDFLGCNVTVNSAVRIGRVKVKPSSKARLLRVELKSSSDRSVVLQASKYLKDNPSTAAILIVK